MTVQNSVRGIASVRRAILVNATLSIPSFIAGTKDPILVTATKVDPTKPAQVLLQACTPAGCCSNGDPVLTTLRISEGKDRVRESFSDIPAAERFVTVQNGRPGLRKLQVIVNGRRVETLRIGPQESRTIDIASAMMKRQNIITLIGQGRPGASALVLISDVPGADSRTAASTSKHQPSIEWQSGPWQPGVNLHWGK